MPSAPSKRVRLLTVAGLAMLLLGSAACTSNGRKAATTTRARAMAPPVVNVPGTAINLTAQRASLTLPDGTTAPMWGFCATGACGGAWTPGPTIVATAGTSLTINLTNLLPVPTSLVVLGQLGGGLGAPQMMASPAHTGQNYATFPANVPINPTAPPNAFVPPAQGPRVRSFGTEVPAAVTSATGTTPGTAVLQWSNLKPGTYLYETGTLPSLEVPMGLYGLLVVTTAPATGAGGFTPGTAYPGVPYDADASLLLSELDVVQNRAVDAAAVAGADVNKRFNDPTCTATAPCYPAAVNYAPTYFLVNGAWFDRTAPQLSAIPVPDATTAQPAYASGNVLVRLANAGSRTHVPTIVGLPMALVAEDGNLAPPVAPAAFPFKLEDEVLLTAGKTYDVIVRPPAATGGTSYAPATYPVFDRALSLSSGGRPDGGMQAFLLVDPAGAQTTVQNGQVVGVAGTPGNLPATVVPVANPDSYNVPFSAPGCGASPAPACSSLAANVTSNDVGVARVGLGTGVTHGTLVLNPDGSFTYAPTPGYVGADGFTYYANGNPALSAAVTLSVASMGLGAAPIARADAYTSAFTNQFAAARPGVLANDTDPSGYPLQAGGVSGSTCGSVSLQADGSFSVTGGGASCQFSYTAVNSQGTASAPASVTVQFGAPGAVSGLQVSVVDAANPAVAVADYRWTLQEDLTFKHAVGTTPPVSTRTVGTSFHRSHMPVVATGCVGPVSCGSGQSILDPATGLRHVVTDAEALARQTTMDPVALDTTRHYYVSILPGDGATSAAGHTMSGGEVKLLPTGKWAPLTVKVQASPLVTAQMSVYIYEDDAPTNGQNEPGESPLGGFNIILFDPAGRTGDPAGQQTYDAFNMPLSNALLGTPGCPDDQNEDTNGTGTSTAGNLVGVVYTCPNDPNAGTPQANPARYALAGHALIKNLTPARYDVIAHPGAAREGEGEVWWQTETLEGTPAQDAFVGIKEPVYFQEFGPPGPHVTIGFVNPDHVAAYAAASGLAATGAAAHTITGKVTNQHMSRPSDVTLWDSGSYAMLSATTCQVVLNSQAGDGPAIAAAQCDPDGNFTLTGVPAGTYDLAVFDQWLDQIIQNVAVTVPANVATVAMGDLPVLSWFTQYDQNIFQDLNGNGKMDAGEPGISNVPLTVRYRNGALSNVTLSDSNGNGILPELFPLFNWYVAEADTTRFKQTGVHVYVDGGGKPDTTGAGAYLWNSTYAQTTDGSTERVEQPGALSYGIQSFISQRNRVEWGRTPYAQGENGGIVGYVVNSTTRPFDDMRFNVQTIWEPLVPRVTVNLYRKETLADGTQTLALVDSTQTSSFDDFVNLVWGSDGNTWQLGSDGVLRNPTTGAPAPAGVTAGTQVNLQCPGQVATDPFVNYTLGANDRKRCYDGFHSWNQVQAAPYDGRYVFPSAAYVAAHPLCSATVTTGCTPPAPGQTLVSLPPGTYVVEEVTPPGWEVVKEEDKNILIGDAFVPPAAQQFGALTDIFIIPDQATLGNANPNNPGTGDPGFQSDPTTNLGNEGYSNEVTFPACVGNLHRVPDYLSLYPQAQQVAPFAGMDRPLCDRKQLTLRDQQQASATFFVFTEVPAASNNTGIILDDASSEFNAVSPDFGEKASVPFVPVSTKDFAGVEIGRTYSDQWGAYNMMTPSSWLVNPPTPSGYGPNMLITCINDPGPIPDPANPGRLITDPQYNPAYSNFCYTNPYMPGNTTYLDTPVLPIAAFAAGYNPADCSMTDGQPAIQRVDSSAGFGPWLPATGGTLTVTAQGDVQVPNPAYAGPFATSGLAAQRTITRHYHFGTAKGRVRIGNVDLTAATTWGDLSLTVNVPAGTPSGELSITTAAGLASVDTVTVTVGGSAPARVPSSGSIQAAVDAAAPGDLILVDAGTYNELVIMWKPVRLQGVGAASVIVNAAKYPNLKLEQWRPRINGLFSVDPVTGNLVGTPQIDPLPTQEITGGVVLLEPTVLGMEEGAGVTVLAKNLPAGQCSGGAVSTWSPDGKVHHVTESNFLCAPSRIDGISVTGGDAGGGIYVNGWAHDLEISNDRVFGNAGAYNGGIRVGVPYLELESLPTNASGGVLTRGTPARIAGFGYDRNVKIHHNSVTRNGTIEAPLGNGGAGGGISVCTGTDHYSVDHNYVCGNLGSSDGGGIGHLGFSQGGRIAFNQILFNQSFQQTGSTHGGGIAVVGEPPIAGTVSLGTGDLTIDANLIRGNFAEGGQGGGVRLAQVNGADVAAFPKNPAMWNRVGVTNNMVVNNVSGWAGGGLSLSDTLRASIVNNTVASNDNAGIAGVVLASGVVLPAATGGTPGQGKPAAAGIVSEPTSAALRALLSGGFKVVNAVSQPIAFTNNILWQNRSFYYSGDGRLCAGNDANATGTCTVLADQSTTGQCPAGAAYWDLGILGDTSATAGSNSTGVRLVPTWSDLTAGYAGSSNINSDPQLAALYCNGSRYVPELPGVLNPLTVKNLQVAATLDEGNNYVNLRYGPLYVQNPAATGSAATTWGDYHLSGTGSPDFNTATATDAPSHDFDGQPRPGLGAYDRGADEYYP